ncbi:MAG TPA: DsbA family protein [Pyrinomonadaceae bacterium]|nr:DsbA family protein [Pyrinomonadaceae bacterium]
MKRSLPLLIIAAVLVAAVAATWMLLRSAQRLSTNYSTPTAGSDAPGAEPPHIRGNANAPVTLEEFGDFQCSSCGIYYGELKKIEGEFGDRLRVTFREFPLVPTHQNALVAAQAAEAASLQGRFWEMHDKLYENQKAWSDAKDVLPMFVELAKQIGLDTDRSGRDLSGEVVAARIFQDGKRGHALGVTSTPTFFVNGKEATGESWKPDGLREMIKQALRETPGK